MKEKKDKKDPKSYINLEIESYKRRLKLYLVNSHFDSNELEFLKKEIERIEKEIKQVNQGLEEVLLHGTKEEKEGTEKDPGRVSYFTLVEGYKVAYLGWLSEKKEAFENPYQNINCLPWSGTQDQLRGLFKGLKEGEYIDPKIHFKAFEAIFSNISTQYKPVQWKASNRLLAYLLDQLFGRSYIDTNEWQSIIGKNKLFINKRKKVLTTNDLSQALHAINKEFEGENPQYYYKIDKILETLRD